MDDMADFGDLIETAPGQELLTRIWQGWPEGSEHLYRDGFHLIGRLRWEIEQMERELVREARENRFTWEQIGKWTGSTRQGAYNRFGPTLAQEDLDADDQGL